MILSRLSHGHSEVKQDKHTNGVTHADADAKNVVAVDELRNPRQFTTTMTMTMMMSDSCRS